MSRQSPKVIVGITESVCPECLKRIPARRIAAGDAVYLDKTCAKHGKFRTVIWRGKPAYETWSVSKLASQPPVCATSVKRGCPFDCGLCPEHRQHTCCVLLEVTQRCNLACPVCFAKAGGGDDEPDIRQIESWYRMLLASGGPYNIQLSGGEPTLRDDLPEIIAVGRAMGYDFFQLNTNGLRLADDPGYVRELRKAGLGCVFLQFDGISDAVYETIRGRALLDIKKAAIARCAEQQLGVVLVPTVIPGVNSNEIGAIIRFAVESMPAVRGVHFQPVSYFGRYPKEPADIDRITIPEVISEIERQTGSMMKMEDFRPPSAENAYCSFHGNFVLLDNGQLKAGTNARQTGCCCQPRAAAEGAKKARTFVAKRWSASPAGGKEAEAVKAAPLTNTDSLDAFLDRVNNYSLSVSGMAFQDVWNLDLERLRECFIHVVSPDARIIPFCAYNLTDRHGMPLYRQL